VRSAVCDSIKQAKTSRLHNDTNVLSLGSIYLDQSMAKRIVNVWLNTPALPGRHKRRVNQIIRFEKKKA
jgi:ribose 5-phosphate isomerase B